MNRLQKVLIAGSGVILAASATLPGAPPAAAGDLETLRQRAQAVADEVTALEHRLEDLRGRATRLDRNVERITTELGIAEIKVDVAADELAEAEDLYVTRAVFAYKRPASFEMNLMLSANSLADLYRASQVSTEIAKDDSDAVGALQDAKAIADAAEAELADRRERLVAKQAEADEVADETATALTTRRRRLSALTKEITKLEEQARRAAERAATPASFLDVLSPSGPSGGIPAGFASTGVSFEGVASWYGPGFEGNLTANGEIFDPSGFTAASLELPFGTWLYVEHEGRGVVVVVNDRGPYIDGRILDLSQGAAEAIGIYGLGWIRAEILVKG